MTPAEFRVLQQRIDELAGVRRATGANLNLAAVRIGDLAPLLQVTEEAVSAKAAGGTVTVAEFNAVVAELHAIHTVLRGVKVKLRTRLGR